MQQATRKIFLHPGEMVFAEPGTHVHTILGSCVAICLWHPLLGIGGMCHFVLPTRPAGTPRGGDPDGRYGDEAMTLFDRAIALHRTEPGEYQAKIFGGANAFPEQLTNDEDLVGRRNISRAKLLLQRRNIEIRTVQVSDTTHQRIVMDFSTGHVWVRNSSARPADRIEAAVQGR